MSNADELSPVVVNFFLPYGIIFISLQSKTMWMEQNEVIERIKETAERVLPRGASLWLYGSRARGDARPDSDYDLLILIDNEDSMSDADSAAYDLCVLGFDYGVEVNPHIYSKKRWNSWTYSPFYKNVEQDKIVLR